MHARIEVPGSRGFFRCLHGSSDHKDSGTQTGPLDPECPEGGRGTAKTDVHDESGAEYSGGATCAIRRQSGG